MASLKSIINSDDDQPSPSQIKDPDAPGTLPSDRVPSSTNISRQPPSTRQANRTPTSLGKVSHSSSSFSSTSASQLPPLLPIPTDPSRSGGASATWTPVKRLSYSEYSGSTSSSTGAPRQEPIMADVSPNPSMVKYTPVTGRPSRAKKGLPVHVCRQCNPAKTFTRAEHLRRHELSHDPPSLACSVPGCDKSFHRKDLLRRHVQTHELERDERQQSQTETTMSPVRSPVGLISNSAPTSMVGWPTTTSAYPTSQALSSGHRYLEPSYNPQSALLPSSREDRGPGWASSHNVYPSSPPNWSPYTLAPTPWQPSGTLLDHNSTVRSLPPHVPVVPQSEPLVNPPSSSLIGNTGSRVQISQRDTVQAEHPLPGVLEPLLPSTSILDAVPSYLDVFWDRVELVPTIVHRVSLAEALAADPYHVEPLRYVMAALATQHLDDKLHRINGHELYAYAWRKVKIFTERNDWSLPVMQTVIIAEYYARFRGRSKDSYKPSEEFRTVYQLAFDACSGVMPDVTNFVGPQGWRSWTETETKRRLLSAAFLLDVHSMCCHEQPSVSIDGLDYTAPTTLLIPMTLNTNELWGAATYSEWLGSTREHRGLATISTIVMEALTPEAISVLPFFDASLLLMTYLLQLRRWRHPTRVELIQDARSVAIGSLVVCRLFYKSPYAYTFMALHYTPLHTLLSVSGDSWVFNKKVTPPSSFSEHKAELEAWRSSGTAAVATALAARALRMFLNIREGEDGVVTAGPAIRRSISDFWNIYACSLILWAFGHTRTSAIQGTQYEAHGGRSGSRSSSHSGSVIVVGGSAGESSGSLGRDSVANEVLRQQGMQWLLRASESEPGQLQGLDEDGRAPAQEVVTLAREALDPERVCGRNMLLADAVAVLKRLEDGRTRSWS